MKEFERTSLLIGSKSLEKIQNNHILICGVGGVGSFVLESIARLGIKKITIVDFDIVDITNINRQLYALHSTIGLRKVDVARNRVLDINPSVSIKTYFLKISSDTIDEIFSDHYDFVVDAIDDVQAKVLLIQKATSLSIPIISSMGTGNKLDPTKLKIMNLNQTSYCPLAKKMRYELKKIGITHLTVLSSTEQPSKSDPTNHTTASISFVPSTGGLLITSEVVKQLLNKI